MSKNYKIIEQKGENIGITTLIGRFAMSPEVIREMGGFPILTSDKFHWWVALDGKKVVSFAAIKVQAKSAVLTYAYTVPEHRRKGLHKRLLNERIQWAMANGITILKADCTPASLPNFKKLGFTVIKEFTGWTKVEKKL